MLCRTTISVGRRARNPSKSSRHFETLDTRVEEQSGEQQRSFLHVKDVSAEVAPQYSIKRCYEALRRWRTSRFGWRDNFAGDRALASCQAYS
jgi:hypothetical protein